MSNMNNIYDIAIVGSGPAGLSANVAHAQVDINLKILYLESCWEDS